MVPLIIAIISVAFSYASAQTLEVAPECTNITQESLAAIIALNALRSTPLPVSDQLQKTSFYHAQDLVVNEVLLRETCANQHESYPFLTWSSQFPEGVTWTQCCVVTEADRDDCEHNKPSQIIGASLPTASEFIIRAPLPLSDGQDVARVINNTYAYDNSRLALLFDSNATHIGASVNMDTISIFIATASGYAQCSSLPQTTTPSPDGALRSSVSALVLLVVFVIYF